MFKKATKSESKLRMALIGPAGSGKTYTALSIAAGLSDRIAVLDSEHGSASKYSDLFTFDVMEPETFSPQVYIDAITEAAKAGYQVIILDSLSHAWAGKGGALEMVDAASRRAKGNKFVAWGEVTPLQQTMVDTILTANIHVIATIRSKMEYAQDLDSEGRKVVRRLGMQPVQRDQLEYEFDIIGDLDNENTMTVTKSRIPALSGAVIRKPGRQLSEALAGWLTGQKREPSPAIPTRARLAVETPTAAPAPASAPTAPAGPESGGDHTTDVTLESVRDWHSMRAYLNAMGGQYPDEDSVRQTMAARHLGTPPANASPVVWQSIAKRLAGVK